MKNFTRTTILSALATLALASCSKDMDSVSEQKESGLMTLTVEASLPDYGEGTKGSLVNTVRIAWQNGDKVSVYDNTGCLGTLDAVLNGSSDKYAILSGTINSSSAEKLTLIAASEGMEPVVTDTKAVKFDIAAQDKESAPYVAYATVANPNATTVSQLSTSFSLATAVIKVNCAGLKEGVPATKATIDSVFTELTITPSASGEPSISSEKKGSITRTISGGNLGTANAEGIMTFTVAVLAQDVTDRVIKVSQEKWPTSATFSAAALTKGYSYNTVCQLCGPYKTVGGHSGVRLWDGGPYWATTNLGAESQTAYGWYYMWADTQGYEYNSGFKKPTGEPIAPEGFAVTTAPYYSPASSTYHKYTDASSSQLEPIDDAARLEWGSSWRIPTHSEFTDLIDKCDSVWSSRLGGYLFTGKGEYADVSVFFPATGYCNGTSAPQNVGNMGSYWSSTLVAGTPVRAYRFLFQKDVPIDKGASYFRFLGSSIRPVMD